jgi:hypothetical protein
LYSNKVGWSGKDGMVGSGAPLKIYGNFRPIQ